MIDAYYSVSNRESQIENLKSKISNLEFQIKNFKSRILNEFQYNVYTKVQKITEISVIFKTFLKI